MYRLILTMNMLPLSGSVKSDQNNISDMRTVYSIHTKICYEILDRSLCLEYTLFVRVYKI
jgi:hypothetical protein